MNIVLCAVQVPFVRGGAEVLTEGLHAALAERGHEVATVAVPFSWSPKADILRSAMAWRLLDIAESNGRPVDLVICTKFPSYAVKHPNKVTWLVHQHRQAYDWYGTPYSDFVNADEDNRIRRLIARIDRAGLGESRRIFSISRNVADRLKRFSGLNSTPLYPPPANLGFHNGPSGDYVLFVGRLDRAKRPDLLIRALAHTTNVARAVIAGRGPGEQSLRKLARDLGAGHRVEFTGYVDNARLVDLYANSLCVFYTPVDEDYGYTTIEAFRSGKPVITSTDAGGVLEFVRQGETGLVADPEPAALARCINVLYEDRALSQAMGSRGEASVRGINWDVVIGYLLG